VSLLSEHKERTERLQSSEKSSRVEDFLELVRIRKSIRTFNGRSIDHELIKKIIEIATYAPSNCNQQLWNFIVVDDQATKERLINEAASSTLIRRAPTLVVVTYDGWNYKEAIQGASLAVGHLILAGTYYGIGSLPMNSYGADSKTKVILGIPETETICCFVALGYPDSQAKQAPRVKRRPVKEALHWNRFHDRHLPPFTYHPNDWSLQDLISHQRYYSRKTLMGKEMDVMSTWDRELIRYALSDKSGEVADLLTYDGAYLSEFDERFRLHTIDLCQETSQYTKAAIEFQATKASLGSQHIYRPGGKITLNKKVDLTTLLYKAERIPDKLKEDLYRQAYDILKEEGEFFLVARKKNWLLSFFFFVIRRLFGKDLRRTGIFNFFGPYQPIDMRNELKLLKKSGFEVRWSGFFLFPPFYDQVYQMMLQYFKSEGSSYLHREKRQDLISRLLGGMIRIQGTAKVGFLGSGVIIRCRK
jgi:nitroreductase